MMVKRFQIDGSATFVAETKDDTHLERGDLIKLEHLLYRVKDKYYSAQGFMYVGEEIDQEKITCAHVPF